MNCFRSPTFLAAVIIFNLCSLSPARADARAEAIEKARQHLPPATSKLLPAVFVVVIGYEGNLPLFKEGVIPPPQNGTGLAVPVDKDGYFLTAAHSVQPTQDMYIMGNFEGKLEARKAEIIFRGDPETAIQDFALLRVSTKLPVCFEFADNLPQRNDMIYAAVRSQNSPVFIEGKCLTPSASYGTLSMTAVMSDLPVIGRDSGGPLLTQELRLIGLTSRGSNTGWGNFTYSCCPSRTLVERLITEAKAKKADASPEPKPVAPTH